MNFGFFRVCCASPKVTVADCFTNTNNIISCIQEATKNGTRLIVFPELSITGYTCGDLFQQTTLQENAKKSLLRITESSKTVNAIILTGFPLPLDNALYNCAAVIFKGSILAVIPKSFIPNYGEFYERRQFAGAAYAETIKSIYICEEFPNVPFGTDILIKDPENPGFTLGVEICEDLWVPTPPSIRHTAAGATIIANLSASNEIIGKADFRRLLIKSQSAHTISAYLYANAGSGESTTDMIFAAHDLIAENGTLLSESSLFSDNLIYADIDLERLQKERRRTTTFSVSSKENNTTSYRILPVHFDKETTISVQRYIDPFPFVPSDLALRSERCKEVILLQAQGLAKRIRHINTKNVVLGLSGGLDSTLALLVTAVAFDICNLDRKGIITVTMPCFGTTDRTYKNACKLAEAVGSTLKEINIMNAVKIHFHDIGQKESVHDVTYENCQARERTQVLMDIANKENGIVIGTGDLSELALGWATYNGDHMSMYGVNSSVPKTLVRYLVQWYADDTKNTELSQILNDILNTPVSPELLPPSQGQISQKTEEIVGPYELHDFFLYYVLRFGFSPSKIYFLAQNAFDQKKYSKQLILKWLKIFYKRFFSQQFKRSCLPDGAKVGTVNLSPRGDWRMPSDASSKIWLQELETL